MASTQKLTELPVIQYAGMDYTTVISQIKSIIESNNNWKENWTQFYSSEAGTMLIQLMAWICDNLAVRQDMIYNESFISTAKNYTSKLRFLNQIKYDIKCSRAATVPITINLNAISNKKINLSCYGYLEGSNYEKYQDYTPQQREMQGVRSIKNSIFSFQAPNINGESVNWEILNISEDGEIEYKTPVILNEGEFEYTTYDNGNKKIKALQGVTKYKEFSSDTANEPVFNLYEQDIDLDSLVVYDIKGNEYTPTFYNGVKHKKVPNFIDITTLKDDIPCYIIERDDDGYLQLRYPSVELGKSSNNELLANHLYKAGHTVGIFYRKSNGSDGNVSENIFNTKTIAKDEDGNSVNITITNVLSGYGGFDMENIDTAIKNAPLTLRTLNRAVTSDDYDIILNNNNFVLKSKTFTPDNMPTYFSSFYGREIWPHEAFSIIVSNKNIKNIPNSYLNKFPWIETNKSHAINEKVSFTEHKFNSSINKKFDPVFGLFIKDTYVEENKSEIVPVKKREDEAETVTKPTYINCLTDDGTIFTEEFDIDGTRLLKNAVVYNCGKQLINYILNEKEKFNGSNNPYELVVKLNSDYYRGNSFADISNVFFKEDKLSVNKNVLVDKDVSATFTSTEDFVKLSEEKEGIYEKISVSKINKPIKIVIDDSYEFEFNLIDLIKEEYAEKFEVFKNFVYENFGLTITLDMSTITEEMYDISLSNSNYSDLVFNSDDEAKLISIFNGINDSNKFLEFFRMAYVGDFTGISLNIEPSVKRAFLQKFELSRKGLEQLINEEYNKRLYALAIENEELKDCIWTSRQLKTFKNINIPEEAPANTFDIVDETGDGLFFGTVYQDIGLNLPDFTVNTKYNNSDILKKDKIDREKMPFYNKDIDTSHFYRIKINGKIYAIRIDNTSINKANEFFGFTGDNEYTKYSTDFFKFNGVEAYKQQDNSNYIIDIPLAENISAYQNRLKGFNGELCSSDSIVSVFNKNTSSCFNSLSNDDGYCLCSESLALLLEYLFSPSNSDKEMIYSLENSGTEKVWVDLHDSENYRKVLDGSLRVHSITKKYYKYDSINKYKFDDEFYDDICSDVRFEYIRAKSNNDGTPELSIGSVSDEELEFLSQNSLSPDGTAYAEIEIGTGAETQTEVPKDFFQELFGYRKNYTATFPDETKKLANIIENNDETVKFILSSKKKGINSSLYLISYVNNSDDEEDIKNNTIFNLFSCNNISENKTNSYYSTEKSYGIRRMELFNAGVTFDNEEAEAYSGSKTTTLQAGDVILTDNDINMINIPEIVYLSYISRYNKQIDITKQTSLYYSDNEDTTEAMEIRVTGLDGQSVKSTVVNGETIYTIDEASSSFNFKITDDEIDYTNNFNCIDDSNLKKYVKSESFSLFTTNIIPTDSSSVASLAFTIDEADAADTVKETGFVAENLLLSEISANKIYDSIIKLIPQEHKQYNNRYKIIRVCSDNYSGESNGNGNGNDNRLIFSNIDNRISGNITFYCIDDNDEATCELFKILFGTSKTNEKFYKLYPKEEMSELNVIKEDDEYWYSPIAGAPLTFKFRTFVNEEESKYADYYIECAGSKFAENNSDSTGYKFSLVKTETSNLPDGDFYIHYINDRTYEKKRNTEEDQLNEYMKKYAIDGTKMHYLNPFFRTFDIAGNIYYNENYNVKNISESVNNVLSAKYKIGNISNIDVGNKIYLSDIIKLITDIYGIEHVEITYFGFDITDTTKYPSSSKYLSISETYDFYTIILLAETDSKHGIQFSYAIDEA